MFPACRLQKWLSEWSAVVGSSVLQQQAGVLDAQVGAQRVYSAVRGRAVGTEGALRGVAVEVVPPVGHLLAARLAAPQRRAVRGSSEHAVIGQSRAIHLCNGTPTL